MVPLASMSAASSTRSASDWGMFHCRQRFLISCTVMEPSRLQSILRKAARMDEKRSFTSLPSMVLPSESTFSAEPEPRIFPVMMSYSTDPLAEVWSPGSLGALPL
eukprot:CAMPEP_0204510740 /NCGR_PEP_ID=MMETSP0661-20131031/58_1 /ASSEMBLY_ACC=CAM_ASM_000606 /TAXON_ID=109239 /ORGANISM="Alexandrium margalefi, Strain AMGDE01CS-322" /LENGTH=104 /DNA_ID=CAMNT_0051515785 /DNA_START=48 /DNA_END=359 /DNA_ORIENTATION=-